MPARRVVPSCGRRRRCGIGCGPSSGDRSSCGSATPRWPPGWPTPCGTTSDWPPWLPRWPSSTPIWRLYGGWYDGNPAHLKPAPDAALAVEVATLAGGADVLARRAAELAEAGDLRLAGHLAELATQADPASTNAHRVRADVNEARARAERSTMAKGVFRWAATESREQAGPPG